MLRTFPKRVFDPGVIEKSNSGKKQFYLLSIKEVHHLASNGKFTINHNYRVLIISPLKNYKNNNKTYYKTFKTSF